MDILLLICITAFLVHRLWSVLGTRNGNEKKHPFMQISEDNVIILPKKKISEDDKNDDDLPDYQKNILSKVYEVLPDFEATDFIDKAKNAYEFIIEAFVTGNKNRLKKFLNEQVFDIFSKAIDKLSDEKIKQETQVLEFLNVDVEKSEVDRTDPMNIIVRITLLIKTKQIIVLYNDQGEIIENPAKISSVQTDIWTFERSVDTDHFTWILCKTKKA